jgi:hypothetical protein
VLLEAFAELPHLHADDVVFSRAVIRPAAENAPSNLLLPKFFRAIRKRPVADVEQQLAEFGTALESGAGGSSV